MKGVSAVIATLLMLVITVALAITAYGFITNSIGGQITKLIDIVDITCDASIIPVGTSFNITLKNTDPINPVTTSSILIRIDDVAYLPQVWIVPGTPTPITTIAANNNYGMAGIPCGSPSQPLCGVGSAHSVKVLGPSGRALSTTVAC